MSLPEALRHCAGSQLLFPPLSLSLSLLLLYPPTPSSLAHFFSTSLECFQSLRGACNVLPSLAQRSSPFIHTSTSIPGAAEAAQEVIQPEHWINSNAEEWTGEENLKDDDPEMWEIIQKVGLSLNKGRIQCQLNLSVFG